MQQIRDFQEVAVEKTRSACNKEQCRDRALPAPGGTRHGHIAQCTACQNCKFRADSISLKENKEYEVILNRLQLDVQKKKRTASYPFCVFPYRQLSQARKCMETQEMQLIMSGRLEEFNSQFYNTVERGVF
jgi:hypothetical protein